MSSHALIRAAHLRLLVLAATLTLIAVTAPPAEATPSGHNGRIAFRRFLDEERSTGRRLHHPTEREG